MTLRTAPKVFVTGGSSGIGAAIVKRLANEGYTVSFTVNKSTEAAAALCADCEGVTRPQALQCDLSDASAVDQLCQKLSREDEPFYGFVHAAGTSYDAPAAAVDLAKARAVMQVNFWSMFALTSALMRGMTRHRSGRILGISSVVSRRGSRGNSIYASSKGAMESFLVNLISEVSHKGVTVNLIAPGYIETRLLQPYEHMRDILTARIPSGNYGSPLDISSLVAFLISPEASYINGARITVDGGLDASIGLAAARKNYESTVAETKRDPQPRRHT